MPVMSVVVSIRSRMALGRLSWRSIWASLRLMKAPVSGPVWVLLSTPTTVKLWLTKSALASGGRIGKAIVSPAFFLNSTAKSEPRTNSPEHVTTFREGRFDRRVIVGPRVVGGDVIREAE